MARDVQELKWLESRDFTAWGTHVLRTSERKIQEPQGLYSLSGACTGTLNGHIAVIVGGKEELPSESFTSVSRLDLFDLTASKWLTGYDVHGELTHRVGHSVVTLDERAYVFGGEPIAAFAGTGASQQLFGDVYEISFENSVLRCTDVSPIDGGADPNASPSPAPSERAWHASAAVRYREATSDPESPPTQGVLVLGGKNAQGAIISDVWLLIVNGAGQKPRWVQLSPSGNSPLPLAFHNAVTLEQGDKVLVLGGRQHADPLAPAVNSAIHILDLTANAWSVVTTGGENPENCPVLTSRCCATALVLQLPIDEETGNIRRFKDGEVDAKPQAAVVIFGGFSEYEPALHSSSMIILEPQRARIREVQVPMAGIKSYMGHAAAVRPDEKGFFLFGGVPVPDDEQPQHFLDSTTALDFWETPAGFPSEAEEEALRQAAANPIKTKTLGNGDVYVGEMNADQTQRHGKGKCSYANGDEYDGDWRDDQRCGQGVMRYASSQDVYAGQWEGDQRHGFGIYELHLSENSSSHLRQPKKYEGHWKRDRKHGSGTLTYTDDTYVVGSWANDVFDSREKSTIEGFDDGQNGKCRYVGEVCDGVPHGQGESAHDASGEVYVGSWVTGRRQGHGVATLRDGSVYRGEWRNGRRNGFGAFNDARTRAHYDGKWVGGVRCGRGACKYANGCVYEGDWLDDVRHGTGRYTFTDGSCYDGAWLQDKFCGDGSFMLCIEDGDTTAKQGGSNTEAAD